MGANGEKNENRKWSKRETWQRERENGIKSGGKKEMDDYKKWAIEKYKSKSRKYKEEKAKQTPREKGEAGKRG